MGLHVMIQIYYFPLMKQDKKAKMQMSPQNTADVNTIR